MSTKANGTPDYGSGYLEISEKGFGFLRSADNHFQPKPTDIFVTPDTIKKNYLREGSLVAGPLQPPHRGTSPQLREVEKVNGMPFAEYTKAVRFENLTTIDPTEKFQLETTPDLIERCRRMVESGKDVFVLLDSLTRVARAYNSVHGGSGRTMTGGVDARALEIPRKMFASARKIEGGGSLTILATALVDTGSRMDELIFQEFKGTGNMELILDRKLSDRRLFPAIDIPKSGTRKEEKLFPAKHIEAIRKLRRTMVDLNPVEAMETLIAALKKHKTNEELLLKLV